MNTEGKLSIEIKTMRNQAVAVKLHSTRQVLAASMFEGQEPAKALQLLPVIFSICGTAQAVAGVRACESAMGKPAMPDVERQRERLLAMENLREHLWRVFLDWPSFVRASPQHNVLATVFSIQRQYAHALDPDGQLFQPGARQAQSQGLQLPDDQLLKLLHQAVFGMPVESWLKITTLEEFDAWMENTPTIAARYMRKVRNTGQAASGSNDIRALPVLDEGWVCHSMADDRFIHAPQWKDKCWETSAYTMTHTPMFMELRNEYGNGLLSRLMARLCQIATNAKHLFFPVAGYHRPTAQAQGLGQVHAARGQLYHRVVLAANERIEHYRILAPTEWNFHPQGVVTQALKTLKGDRRQVSEQAHQLIKAIDPCVAYELTVSGS